MWADNVEDAFKEETAKNKKKNTQKKKPRMSKTRNKHPKKRCWLLLLWVWTCRRSYTDSCATQHWRLWQPLSTSALQNQRITYRDVCAKLTPVAFITLSQFPPPLLPPPPPPSKCQRMTRFSIPRNENDGCGRRIVADFSLNAPPCFFFFLQRQLKRTGAQRWAFNWAQPDKCTFSSWHHNKSFQISSEEKTEGGINGTFNTIPYV